MSTELSINRTMAGPPTLTHLIAAERASSQDPTPHAQTRQWFEAEPLWFKSAVFY